MSVHFSDWMTFDNCVPLSTLSSLLSFRFYIHTNFTLIPIIIPPFILIPLLVRTLISIIFMEFLKKLFWTRLLWLSSQCAVYIAEQMSYKSKWNMNDECTVQQDPEEG